MTPKVRSSTTPGSSAALLPRRRAAAMLAATLSAAAFRQASAQTWQPSRPVRLVVPYAPGGPVDTVTRRIAHLVGPALGQAVLVENRPGANTGIGAEHVARSAPDGHTLLVVAPTTSVNTLFPSHRGYRMEEFAPVATFVRIPYALVVSPNLPVRNLDDLKALAQSRPSGLNSGIIGVGSLVHLTTEMLRQALGIPMVHVPYRGGGPATTALISGEIDIYVTGVVNAIPLARSGTLRILGVASEKRLPGAPEFPTFVDQGYPSVVSNAYYGILAPAQTPESILQRLGAEVVRAAEDREFRAAMERDGAVIDAKAGEAFGRIIAEDLAVWAEVIRRMDTQLQP